MNLVPLAAIKGGRAVELAWHTEEGKEVKGVDFNNIYIYVHMYIHTYTLYIYAHIHIHIHNIYKYTKQALPIDCWKIRSHKICVKGLC